MCRIKLALQQEFQEKNKRIKLIILINFGYKTFENASLTLIVVDSEVGLSFEDKRLLKKNNRAKCNTYSCFQ